MGSIKSGIYGMVRWRGTMPEFELRFRLHCDVGGEQRYGWEQLQTRMKTGYSERLLQIWADVLHQRGVGKKEDRVIFVCLEGGIGTKRKIRNATRIQSTPKNADYGEILFRMEEGADPSGDWTHSQACLFGDALRVALEQYLGSADNIVDFYVVLNETLSSDEESSHYDESDGDSVDV